MKYKIFTTKEFDRLFNKLDPEVKKQIGKKIDQLENNPFVGKSLGYNFFREKKIQNYRIYYLIYKGYLVVFVISLSDKKGQQKAIDMIKELIPKYKEEILKRIKK